MSFNPKQEYIITEDKIKIRDFHEYAEDYVTRPPYQRKSVWSKKKKQALIDSLFRRYYVPRLVVREVRLSDDRTIREIIDGQQRITSIQEFFAGGFALPKSLKDIHAGLPGKTFQELDSDLRKFIDKEITVSADIVKNIDNPRDPEHQKVATEIFHRLQLGESLNTMEVAHAQLSSLSRNFIVKHSDDITFDFKQYTPVDDNPDKHPFFRLVDRKNDRMQHLMLMTRFLLIEEANGYAELRDTALVAYVDNYRQSDGVGSDAHGEQAHAKECLKVLDLAYAVFKDDPMHADGSPVKELKREYVIISIYVLLRHLRRYYAIGKPEQKLIRSFVHHFWDRWQKADTNDRDIVDFSIRRQQDLNSLRERDIILRQLFFEYLESKNSSLTVKDEKRAFSEAERIRIYRRDQGICQTCIEEGKSEKESFVIWTDYEADHVFPHSKGGQTDIKNGRVLCSYHNASKGASVK